MEKAVNIIADVVKTLGRGCSYIVPTGLAAKIGLLRSFFYTGYISRSLKHVGKGTIISKGCAFEGAEYISIGDGCRIGKGGRIFAVHEDQGRDYRPEISIGNNTIIGKNCFVTSINKVTIGQSCLFGTNVLISDNSHGNNSAGEISQSPSTRKLYSKGPVHIGNKVWIGENASILSGVTIGDGSVIGANSVVTKDVPPYCVAAGTPARIVKQITAEVK